MVKGVRLPGIAGVMILMIILLALPVLGVQSRGHITLLAVYHEGQNFSGSPADLELEIKPGRGRVFIETIPLSKVDTQISTRFAKSMACKFAEADCGQYDFFYTIKSAAGIVGGPSAGGAVAVLTAAMLMDIEVDQKATVTGTINSGELIGPVGSLKEKVDAAKAAGIDKVLIPAVQQDLDADNVSSLIEYGKEHGVEVVPVNTLSETMTGLTDQEFYDVDKEIIVPESYVKTMKEVSDWLCKRSEELISQTPAFDLNNKREIIIENIKDIQTAKNFTKSAELALEEKKYYSRASYCFAASQKAQKVLIEEMDISHEDYQTEIENLREERKKIDADIERMEKETMTDLQTYMIVKDRLLQAKKLLDENNNSSSRLAHAIERINSARTWSQFFGKGGEKYDLDEASLKQSCERNLQEVEERFQYLNLFFTGLLNDLRDNLNKAHEYYKEEEYGLCIFLASRTKADANILVTMLGVKEESVDMLLEQKLKAAKRAITKQIDKGTFPILAYSYYEYSTSLKENNKISALLYSEYALEMSDLNIFFEAIAQTKDYSNLKLTLWKIIPIMLFLWGLFLGYAYAWLKGKEKKGTGKESKEKKKGKKQKTRQKAQKKHIKEKTTRTKIRFRG